MFSNLTISYDFLSIRLNLIYREQTSFFIIIFYLILAYISSYILINHDYLTIRFFSFLSWANLTDHVSRSVYKWPNNINSKIKIVTTIPPKTPHDPCWRLSKRYWGVVICFILFVNQEQGLKIRQLWCRSLNYQIHLHQDNFLLLHLNLVFAHIIIICQRNLRVFFEDWERIYRKRKKNGRDEREK